MGKIKELFRSSVDETLSELLDAETVKMTQAARYEHYAASLDYHSGHYVRDLATEIPPRGRKHPLS